VLESFSSRTDISSSSDPSIAHNLNRWCFRYTFQTVTRFQISVTDVVSEFFTWYMELIDNDSFHSVLAVCPWMEFCEPGRNIKKSRYMAASACANLSFEEDQVLLPYPENSQRFFPFFNSVLPLSPSFFLFSCSHHFFIRFICPSYRHSPSSSMLNHLRWHVEKMTLQENSK
jgi:hypothetical protein